MKTIRSLIFLIVVASILVFGITSVFAQTLQPTRTPTPTPTPPSNAAVPIIHVNRLMPIASVHPSVPVQNIDVSIEKIELNVINTIWYMSAWNRNTSDTGFYNFWRWDVYVTDELGTSYQMSNIISKIGPRPGERLEFELVFPPVKAGARSLTLHTKADVRTCIFGWCDYPISWENVTVTIPAD